ncbi:HD-GYP domain-containing protein [Nitrospira sp. NS4]|uniref:HD-GYP domain-containing protein n=1 Tax=Nitrospira sp. NS4 TaxID=3414498 RepID=UPI003C30BFA9
MTNLLNVAIVTTKMGMRLGYFGKELERLALAGLVHDVGLCAVPRSLVTKEGRLSPEERMVIEQHPELGYGVIKRVGPEYLWLAQLVRQAHERTNGLGYPNRLKGRQISEMAQIIGVADVFDALISERPYRRRMLPHEAMKELMVAERLTFPREIIKALVEQLSVYPLGTTVRLTTGETGLVVGSNPRYPLRPIVKVDESRLEDGHASRQVDLSLTPLVAVIEALNPPVVGDVIFDSEIDAVDGPFPAKPGSASDQFSSLLESLDVIALAIQGVVQTKEEESSNAEADGSMSAPRQDRQDGSGENSNPSAFILEARECLGHIKRALAELASCSGGIDRTPLYDSVFNGMIRLVTAASSSRMEEIEALAVQALPLFRQAVGECHESFREFEAALAGIVAAIDRLACEEHHKQENASAL